MRNRLSVFGLRDGVFICPAGGLSEDAGPEVMVGVEPLHLAEVGVGVLSRRYSGAGNPPVRAGEPGGQIRPGSGLSLLLATGLRLHFTVGGLPQADAAVPGTQQPRRRTTATPPPRNHLVRPRRPRGDQVAPGRSGVKETSARTAPSGPVHQRRHRKPLHERPRRCRSTGAPSPDRDSSSSHTHHPARRTAAPPCNFCSTARVPVEGRDRNLRQPGATAAIPSSRVHRRRETQSARPAGCRCPVRRADRGRGACRFRSARRRRSVVGYRSCLAAGSGFGTGRNRGAVDYPHVRKPRSGRPSRHLV